MLKIRTYYYFTKKFDLFLIINLFIYKNIIILKYIMNIKTVITPLLNISDSFVIDNLKIYLSFAFNTIYIKIFNTLTFTNYEISIYESDIIDNKFKINELYIFIHKSLKKEDNHTFTCSINSTSMNIELNATFNSYFTLKYEIKLDKKDNVQPEQVIIENNNKDNNLVLIEQIKKDYDNILIKYNTLSDIINSYEISIGHVNFEASFFNTLFTPILNEILNINNLIAQYQIKPTHIVIYFSKIKKLLSLKKICVNKLVSITLYDDTTNSIINNKLLDDYCKSKNIEIILI